MTIKSKIHCAEYYCTKKPTPEEHEKIRERINDPNIPTGMDMLRTIFEKRGLEFDEAMFDNIADNLD
ncbi:MAG: hypothetical protein IJ258_06955 [Methanobrevibacter sp.]|uniref:hypothetical protein n=1 Tax=Methanobrevibacter sp. TaxID=66852 RepID=UPI0025FB5CC9|nr:hypothetical protein [Methanobrevibacter sp.]MBQ8017830.1 hypothetical protein [Methanobrevibacter sp.]